MERLCFYTLTLLAQQGAYLLTYLLKLPTRRPATLKKEGALGVGVGVQEDQRMAACSDIERQVQADATGPRPLIESGTLGS